MTTDRFHRYAAAVVGGMIVGGALVHADQRTAPPEVPAVIELQSEDELCIDVIYDPTTGVLTAEVWRGDPDTCRPVPTDIHTPAEVTP